MATARETAIEDNLASPKEASADNTKVVQHNLKDQIAVDKYLSSKEAAKKGLGVKMTRVRPPGAV